MACAPAVLAQTIGDYSRAQRVLLESAMTQAAVHAAGGAASAPGVAASSLAPLVAPVSRSPLPMPMPMPMPMAAVQVSGVFSSGDTSLAEIVVNATAYLLGPGQAVPGTVWHVEAIAADRVVLGRPAGPATADADGVRKVFALPALR